MFLLEWLLHFAFFCTAITALFAVVLFWGMIGYGLSALLQRAISSLIKLFCPAR
jgi:hypothetical protein